LKRALSCTVQQAYAKRKLTDRAVLYVGFECNAKCRFCYYAELDKEQRKWKPLTKLKQEASMFRNVYNNKSVDITGGEPTIYPEIVKLVEFCDSIGLKPTIITNGIRTADKKFLGELKKAGLRDLLISVQGYKTKMTKITGVKGHYKKILETFKNCNELGIPFRINCVIHKLNYQDLDKIARLVCKHGAKVVNFIVFNPYYKWTEKNKIDFQARHSEISPYLSKAINEVEKHGIECNVRYFPFCFLPKEQRHTIMNWMQLSYDEHEWDFACVDSKTEILTKKGWKTIHNLTRNDEVMTLSQKGMLEWQKIQQIHKYDLTKPIEVFEYKGVTTDLVFTKNHTFPVKRKNGFELKKLSEIKPSNVIRKTGKWIGKEQKEIEFYCKYLGNVRIEMRDWCKFLGIWLAEGYTSYSKNNQEYKIGISQSKDSKYYKDIDNLMKRLPFKYWKNDKGFGFQCKSVAEYLHRFGNRSYNKRIPRKIKELPVEYLKELLEWMIKGDGNSFKTRTPNGYTTTITRYCTASEQLADDLQEIALKIGYGATKRILHRKGLKAPNGRGNYDLYRLTILKSKNYKINHKRTKTVKYKGVLWCVTVPNHTIYVRRNGCPVFTGNSWYRWTNEMQLSLLLESGFREVFSTNKYDALYNTFALRIRRQLYVKPSTCAGCFAKNICDGLTKQYFARFGQYELEPIKDMFETKDPLYYKIEKIRGEKNDRKGKR